MVSRLTAHSAICTLDVVSDVDRVYVVSFAGEPPTLTLRRYIEIANDGRLADFVNAIAQRLGRRGRTMEAEALFAVERLLYPYPRFRNGQ
jgi:hypothetical protein